MTLTEGRKARDTANTGGDPFAGKRRGRIAACVTAGATFGAVSQELAGRNGRASATFAKLRRPAAALARALTGFAFAWAVGGHGSALLTARNLRNMAEVAPRLIVPRFDWNGAVAGADMERWQVDPRPRRDHPPGQCAARPRARHAHPGWPSRAPPRSKSFRLLRERAWQPGRVVPRESSSPPCGRT